MRQRLVTASEAAEFLRISRRQLGRLVRRGELPFVRVGARAVRFSEADLSDFVANHREAPSGANSALPRHLTREGGHRIPARLQALLRPNKAGRRGDG